MVWEGGMDEEEEEAEGESGALSHLVTITPVPEIARWWQCVALSSGGPSCVGGNDVCAPTVAVPPSAN